MYLEKNIYKKISKNFNNYNIKKIESGASKKNFYKLYNQDKSYVITDFIKDKKEFKNHLDIYNILKDIEISIPRIIEYNTNENILISEDFGDLRFDKILNTHSIKNLLNIAVDTLIIIKNSINYDIQNNMQKYSYKIFKDEIMELPSYYFPHINIRDKNLFSDFLSIWTLAYKNLNFEFNSFIHKDFNINNLIFLPNKKNHLKCGVIDFQNAFWGDSTWDLFSLLEDSRILFTDEFNNYLIKYFYQKTNKDITFLNFKKNFYFFNCSRQTRLLGRWVKLSKEINNDYYLKFIPNTLIRLKKGLKLLDDKNLNFFYNRYIFNK
tara:strand:+ start:571 stop:1536 length:966 start_codon:yes stop_codon:yes gene_type:complete